MNALREYMDREGINQTELARRLRVSIGLVSLYLSGKRKVGKRVAPRLSELTGVPIVDLLYPKAK